MRHGAHSANWLQLEDIERSFGFRLLLNTIEMDHIGLKVQATTFAILKIPLTQIDLLRVWRFPSDFGALSGGDSAYLSVLLSRCTWLDMICHATGR